MSSVGTQEGDVPAHEKALQEEVEGLKNKIRKFSKGDFQMACPDIEFDETCLILTIGEGEVCRGSFTMKSRSGGAIRGIVYPSSFRMHCLEQGFEGNPVTVRFEYDGRNLCPGHVEQGKFSIVCNGGEYEVSYTAIIEKPYVMTAYGKVQSTDDFKRLAIKDFSEAQRLFRSREFYEVLKYENPRTFHLYDNMRKWSLDEQSLEEFLVGIKQKECIFLTLQGEGMLFEDLKESTKGSFTVIKNTWGYMPVHIHTEGGFITVPRPEITTDDFVGNVYELEFVVNTDRLHAGRNFGKIYLDTPYETLTYDVEVFQNGNYDENHREIEFLAAQILKEYIAYEAGRIDINAWTDSAIEKSKKMRQYAPMDDGLQLFQAHIYIQGERIEEAKWILENYNYNRFAIGKDPTTNAYYLFLTALIRRNGSHVERVVDEIGKTYLRHQDSYELLLMLLALDPQYRDAYRRIKVLEQQFYGYEVTQVLFFLKAYLCFQERTNLLKKLGKFELHVLNFATKYRLITKELALYVANLASQQKSYDDLLFRILERIYEIYKEPMILNTICTLLIKGNKVQQRYFVWYQRAVDAELKIAQLYEYYMETIEEDKVRDALPRSIFLYFMHGNNLDYKKAALLYANLITYEQYASDLYISYREQMVEFAWDQLLKRHINESLKIIYKRFCAEEEMTGERLEAMRDVCYAYEVTTKVKGLKCVLVIEKDGSIKQRVPYREDGAIVYLYDKEARIIWESMEGRFYTDSIAFETKRMFYEPRYLEMCKKYMSHMTNWISEGAKEEVTFENLHVKDIDDFDEKEVFMLCSKRIREDNYEEDDFLLYLCFEMFKRQQYDKVTLTYLANYYCGATKDMKRLWKTAGSYGVKTGKLGERIITQMLFSEDMFDEEEIFIEYYLGGNAYFRLKQAYLAYVSREYMVKGRQTGNTIFEIIVNEHRQDEELADICKIALLHHYAGKEYGHEVEEVLHRVLGELCEKQIVFPFYLQYPENWLREAQLYDKTMVQYRASKGGKVRIVYKMRQNGMEELGYQSESLTPMYENIYVKDFVIYKGDLIRYYFQESHDKKTTTQEEKILEQTREVPCVGRYGKLNAMSVMKPEEREKAMLEYQQEICLADQIFEEY